MAAARAFDGAGRVAMIGAVGDDAFGAAAREALEAEGVDVRGSRSTPSAATGVALIAVDAAGENQISVAPGANADDRRELGHRGARRARARRVVLASLEVPAARGARRGRVVPARTRFPSC